LAAAWKEINLLFLYLRGGFSDRRTRNRTCLLQSRRKPRAQLQRIRSCSGLHILAPVLDRESLARAEGFDFVALRRETQATAVLLSSANPQVPYCW